METVQEYLLGYFANEDGHIYCDVYRNDTPSHARIVIQYLHEPQNIWNQFMYLSEDEFIKQGGIKA